MCCGGGYAGRGQPPARDGHGANDDISRVRFTYTGRTTLSIMGAVTGRQYRFDGTGATLAVDRRDAYALSAVPTLRRADRP